eukprot:TRINITY_DN76148_c0_g1_i1.p1 TRINITY_DN76148_c0_g1~~TRINITY_DN76148_c0_g1_i1.p1  ORF type:complete len:789 (-),score=132.06 TRINITY_DN76148_c0_g1_i1:111-2384(-)
MQPRNCCLRILHVVTAKMAAWLHRVDASLDWIRLEAGRSLYRKGDTMRGFYVVLSGRLLVLEEPSSGAESPKGSEKAPRRVIGSVERGRLCGELDCLRGRSECSQTVRARRDSEVCRVSPALLHLLAMDFPHAILHFSSRLAGEEGCKTRDPARRLSTIAVVPADASVDAQEVCAQLATALGALGKTLHIHSLSDLRQHGKAGTTGDASHHALQSRRAARLGRALAELEERFQWLIYEADSEVTDWSRRCIRQADVILVAMRFDSSSHGSVPPTAIERYIEQSTRHSFGVERHLLLLHHGEAHEIQKRAVSFAMGNLKKVPSMESLAAQLPSADLRKPGLRGLVEHLGAGLFGGNRKRLRATRHYLMQREWARRWFHVRPTEAGDWGRCARLMVGQGIGLCLGGGGARGNIHFGVIRAMEELGIPIDAVTGTSFGALAGGIYAMTAPEPGSMMRVVKRVMGTTFSTRGMLMDINFPRTSYFTGKFLNSVLQDTFARRRCEDMLVPFACTSTDILNFEAKSHREGHLWHIIRASMSLVGFVPPLPHLEKRLQGGRAKIRSSLLVDGGYTNQYPTDELREVGAGTVICVQACPDFEAVSTDYGDRVFGGTVALLRLLRVKWRWYPGPDPPPQSEIQERLMFLPDAMTGGAGQGSDVVIQPPIQGYGLLEFNSYRELEQIGYKAARPRLEEWLLSNSEAARHTRSLVEQSADQASAAATKLRQHGNGNEFPANVLRKIESAPVGGHIANLAGGKARPITP